MAVQPTYPHDITKNYVWWIDRRQIAIAYHDLDDGNSGYNGEFLSPIVGYDAKIVDTSIAFNDGGGPGGVDLITDANNNFLNAGFEALQEITVSGSASNNITADIVSVDAGTITLAAGSLNSTESAGEQVAIVSGTGVTVRMYVTKRAEVLDKSSEFESSGQFITSSLDDEPEFPEQFHEALVNNAIAKGYEMIPSKESFTAAAYWYAKYFEFLKKGKAFADNNQVYGSRKVMVNPTIGII